MGYLGQRTQFDDIYNYLELELPPRVSSGICSIVRITFEQKDGEGVNIDTYAIRLV